MLCFISVHISTHSVFCTEHLQNIFLCLAGGGGTVILFLGNTLTLQHGWVQISELTATNAITLFCGLSLLAPFVFYFILPSFKYLDLVSLGLNVSPVGALPALTQTGC